MICLYFLCFSCLFNTRICWRCILCVYEVSLGRLLVGLVGFQLQCHFCTKFCLGPSAFLTVNCMPHGLHSYSYSCCVGKTSPTCAAFLSFIVVHKPFSLWFPFMSPLTGLHHCNFLTKSVCSNAFQNGLGQYIFFRT